MNLRKSRFSSRQKRNLSFKDVKSSVKKGSKAPKYTGEIKCSSKSILKTPTKHQKSILDDSLMVRTSDINLVTSTPIASGVRKRTLRSTGQCDSNEISKLNLFNRMSCPITSTPISKTLTQTKPSEVRLFSVKIMRKNHSNKNKSKPDLCLGSNERSFNCKLSYPLLNSPVEVLSKNVRRSTRNKKVAQSQNVSENVPNNVKMPQSQKPKCTKKISISSQQHSNDSQKSGKKLIVPQNKIQSENKKKYIRKSSTCSETIAFTRSSASKDINSVSNKANEISIGKRGEKFHKSDLFQSYHETDDSKSSKYNLRNSTVPEKTHTKKVKAKKKPSTKTKKLVSSPSPSKKFNCTLNKSNRVQRRKMNTLDIEVFQHSKNNFSELNNETKTSKSSRCSSRLTNSHLSKKTSSDELSSQNSMLLPSQDQKSIQAKRLFDPSSNIVTRSSNTLRVQNRQSSKKTTVNKSSSQSNMTLQSQHSSRRTSTKKQSSGKKIEHGSKTIKTINKKGLSSTKKQKSDESDKFPRKCLTFSGDIPIDDLVLSVKVSEGRKVKSDGFKLPGKFTLKRKRCAIDAIKKADEDYEDDIYESKTFDQFKDLLMDTSDSERSFAVSTPQFPVTPLIRHKTPKFKDCFSPTEYAISRKAAMEYIYRNKKRKSCQKPETPVLPEKEKLDYAQALEEAKNLQKTFENLSAEESDDDSYFSFC